MDIFNPAFWTFMAVIAGIYVILSLGLYVINERTGELISPEFANAQPHR